jgi:predicted dehydrogenase
MSGVTNRRDFLGLSMAATATSLAGAHLLAADAPVATGPNDTIRLGVIGCGSRASYTAPEFAKLPGVRLVAICDVNDAALERAKGWGEGMKQYHDFRDLLADKDIDAVLISTNAHWHVLITMYACQAGKDVYVEKPLSNFIGEGRFAIEAAKKYNRIVQIGTQQHSREHYKKAVEIIQSGRLGDICEVKVWDYDHFVGGIQSPADCDPPKGLDWDFYIGPAPSAPFNPTRLWAYDWFKSTGGGYQVAWGVHHFDIVNWALGTKWPTAVSAAGGNYAYPNDKREWPDTFSAIAEFAPGPVAKNGFLLQYSMRIGCRNVARSHSKCFLGNKASLWIDRGRYTITGENSSDGKKMVPDEEVLASNDENAHLQVFIDNVRNRTQPVDNLEVGHYATNIGHLMNTAYQVGRKIHWDGEKENVINDADANALVHRSYRAPWKLEV